MTIPDFLPVLSKGAHDDPAEGACIMEYVSLLAGEEFSDTPACTHPVLARAAQVVNDRLPDADRHLLVPLIGRLFGTADTRESGLDRRILSVRLAVWSARHVEHLLLEQDRRVCVAAIDAAEAWADNPNGQTAAYANAAANAATTTATAAASAAYYAANAAFYAASAAGAADAANAAFYAVGAAYAAANAGTDRYRPATHALVGFLSDLLDHHAQLTGHVARDVSDDELRVLAATVGNP